MRVYVLLHNHRYGLNTEVFRLKRNAIKEYKKIMREYAKQYGIDSNATNDSELVEATCGESALCIVDTELQ